MELEQLEYFKKVAELQHITKAAEELFISQPSLSLAIHRLEDEFGVPLFERNGRNIVLNEYGEILLRHVTSALTQINLAKSEIRELQMQQFNHLTIASIALYTFPGLMEQIIESNPNVSISYCNYDATALKVMLLKNKLDFCLTPVALDDKKIKSILMIHSPRVVVVDESHPLANREYVRLSDLAEYPFAAHSKGSMHRELLEHDCKMMGFSPKVYYDGKTFYDMLAAVRTGKYLMIMPISRYNTFVQTQTSGLKMIPIKDPAFIANTYLSVNQDAPKRQIVEDTINIMLDYFQKWQKDIERVFPQITSLPGY